VSIDFISNNEVNFIRKFYFYFSISIINLIRIIYKYLMSAVWMRNVSVIIVVMYGRTPTPLPTCLIFFLITFLLSVIF